jgi:hypothetical protein
VGVGLFGLLYPAVREKQHGGGIKFIWVDLGSPNHHSVICRNHPVSYKCQKNGFFDKHGKEY